MFRFQLTTAAAGQWPRLAGGRSGQIASRENNKVAY